MLGKLEGSERGSLATRVFQHLERAILEGELPHGEVLTETKLSAALGVSRTPVREALFQLEQEGLVHLSQKGAVVIGVTPKDIEDIYTMRMLIEGLASRLAAMYITEEELAALYEIVDLQDFYVERGDTLQAWNMDTRFHEKLYEASRSRMLLNTLKSFHNYVRKAREQSFRTADRARVAAREHREILNAIKNRDALAAEHLTAAHIANAKANMQKALEKEFTEQSKVSE